MVISMVGVMFLIFGLGLVIGYFVGSVVLLANATNLEDSKTFDRIRSIRTEKLIKKAFESLNESEKEEDE